MHEHSYRPNHSDLKGVKMTVQQLTLPGEIVKKSNALVRSRIHITSIQASRMLATLIASIRPDEKNFDEPYYLEIKNFLPNDSGKSYAEIRAVCRELARSFAELELEDPIEYGTILIESPFFSRIVYKKGKIEALFNRSVSRELLELKGHFTRYNLVEYLLLPSIYSQRIFEILKSWDDKQEVTITLSSLHETLNTPESLRADFAQFRRRVLEKAHKDITKKTELYFEWEPVKQGRAVEAIRFIFGVKRSLPVAKKKADDAIEKQAQINNTNFLAAIACFKERGAACVGNHQKPVICELCLKIR